MDSYMDEMEVLKNFTFPMELMPLLLKISPSTVRLSLDFLVKNRKQESSGEKPGEGGVLEPNKERFLRRRKPLAVSKAIDRSGGKQGPRINF